jgi:hypothetical protein
LFRAPLLTRILHRGRNPKCDTCIQRFKQDVYNMSGSEVEER